MYSVLSFTMFILFFQTSAQAIVYSGVLIKPAGEKIRFKDDATAKSYELTFATEFIESTIKKLKKADYISFEGAHSSGIASIRIDSINYVGLGDLLSTWIGDDHYCYEFSNFTEFKVYPAVKSLCRPRMVTSRKYAYTINAGEDLKWFLLLSDNLASYAADLDLKSPQKAEISLYDSNTGYILKVIKLRK